jgi:hypothetical protein
MDPIGTAAEQGGGGQDNVDHIEKAAANPQSLQAPGKSPDPGEGDQTTATE